MYNSDPLLGQEMRTSLVEAFKEGLVSELSFLAGALQAFRGIRYVVVDVLEEREIAGGVAYI